MVLAWEPGTKIGAELAERAMRTVDDLTDGRPAPLCMIVSRIEVSTREARAVFSRSWSTTRVAMVGQSMTDRLHTMSTLGVAPSPVPRQFFTSVVAARRWLLDS